MMIGDQLTQAPIAVHDQLLALVRLYPGKGKIMRTNKWLLCFSISLLALGLAVLSVPWMATLASQARFPETTISVDTFDDELNSDGNCSLREAIQAANTDSSVDACAAGSGRDVIVLPAGTYTLTLAGAREDGNATGDIDIITGSVTINGAGPASTIIDGNQLDRVLHVHSGASVEFRSVTIANGHAPDGPPEGKGDDGGGIYNAGALILDHSHVSGNYAGQGNGQNPNVCGDGGQGGGVYNTGVLTVTDSTISGNSAGQGPAGWVCGEGSHGGGGGGIYNADTLVVLSSTIASNVAGDASWSWSRGGHGGDGGGIYNAGTVTCTYGNIVSNTAGAGGSGYAGYSGPGGHGGGIYNGHILAVTGSTFRGNSAGRGGSGDYAWSAYGGDGGGIYNGGTLQVAGCTLSDNAAGNGGFSGWGYPGAAGTGGGIYSSGTLTVADSTISGNMAGDGGGVAGRYQGGPGGCGGGLDNAGSLMLTNSTLSDNRPGYGGSSYSGPAGPDGDGGGLCASGAGSIGNTIIANSALPSIHDCLGSVNSLGYNLAEVPGTCVFTATGDLVNVDPRLGLLADNGGDTFTHALLPGSPAIDQGSCRNAATDQRGQPRPVDIPGIPNADDGCDIGAYELLLPAVSFLSSSPDWIGQTTSFTNTTVTSGTTTYLWSFGDGVTSTQASPTRTYNSPGIYTVVLTATNPARSSVASNPVIVYGPPTANYVAYPTQGIRPLPVTFTSTATTTPPGDPTLIYLWDLQRGTSSLPNPTFTYTEAGVYTVTLTVSNVVGSDTITRTNYILVHSIPVHAVFTASPTSGLPPLTVVFTNTSTGDYTNSLWEFGDGVTSVLAGPTYTYSIPGAYTVTLTVSGPGGTDILPRSKFVSVAWPAYLPVVLR
jgi:CSLREA domain-containing protein